MAVERYLGRISGPLLDRIDLHVELPQVEARTLTGRAEGEPSARVRARVVAARERQIHRLRASPSVFANAHLGPREVRRFCALDEAGEALLRTAIERLGLSGRAYHRVLRLARTIADLAGMDRIVAAHVAEAVQYRALDRTPART